MKKFERVCNAPFYLAISGYTMISPEPVMQDVWVFGWAKLSKKFLVCESFNFYIIFYELKKQVYQNFNWFRFLKETSELSKNISLINKENSKFEHVFLRAV